MGEFNIDLKDRKILFELDFNARQPIAKIAKKVKLSTQVVDYRIKRLEKLGLIKGYKALINMAKLGFSTYRLYFRYDSISHDKEDEIIKYFQTHANIPWFVSTNGRFDMEILVLARNFIHFNQIFRNIMQRFGDNLRNNVTSVSIANFHHQKYWLIGKKGDHTQLFYGGEPSHAPIDKIDLKIINHLSGNARLTNVEIGRELNIAPNTIKYRISRLEEQGIIQAYRTIIDPFKIGFEWYKALVTLKTIDQKIERKLLQFFKMEPNMLYLITCIGPWNVEIEVEVPDNEKFREIMTRFRNTFSGLIVDYETLLVYKEYKLDYFPIKSVDWL